MILKALDTFAITSNGELLIVKTLGETAPCEKSFGERGTSSLIFKDLSPEAF